MSSHTVAATAAVLASKDNAVTQPSVAESSQPESQAVATTTKRDPHALPTFERRSVSPILYLPPMLSSLPEGVAHPGYPLSSPASTPGAPGPRSTESRLPTIDQASLALHHALHAFRPASGEYSTLPYAEAFNWAELELPADEEREWYCVAFRSKRKEGSDGGRELPFLSLQHTEVVEADATPFL